MSQVCQTTRDLKHFSRNMDKTITARRCLTISEKQEILKRIDNALKNNQLSSSELSNLLNLPRSTVSTIISNRKVIENTPFTELSRARARAKCRRPKIRRYEELEKRLEKWLKTQNRKKINGTLLRRKAKSFAEEMEIEGFTASNGWFDRFQKRCANSSKSDSKTCTHISADKLEFSKIKSEDFLSHIQEIPEDYRSIKKQYKILARNLHKWETLTRLEGMKVTRILLKDMSLALAGALGIASFTASNGWLARYKKHESVQRCVECLKST